MKERTDRPYTSEQLKTAKASILSSAPPQGRGAREYIQQLKIHSEDLEGKRVLDLGAGNGLRFARELPSEGIRAEVVSYSPAFFDGKVWNEEGGREHISDPLVVAGMAEELPFAENSFDTVTMFYVTMYFRDDRRMHTCLSEIVRVLKPKGVAYIGPLVNIKKEENENNDTNRRWLNQQKVAAVLEGKAIASWEEVSRIKNKAETYTLRIVKNKE